MFLISKIEFCFHESNNDVIGKRQTYHVHYTIDNIQKHFCDSCVNYLKLDCSLKND